jgi:hypothetical protein
MIIPYTNICWLTMSSFSWRFSSILHAIHTGPRTQTQHLHNTKHCDFILGSGAEIERVWSAAEKTIFPARVSTHPLLYEANLFLRFNEKYWTQYTATQATMIVQRDDSNKRYQKEVGRKVWCPGHDGWLGLGFIVGNMIRYHSNERAYVIIIYCICIAV